MTEREELMRESVLKALEVITLISERMDRLEARVKELEGVVNP